MRLRAIYDDSLFELTRSILILAHFADCSWKIKEKNNLLETCFGPRAARVSETWLPHLF